MTDTLELARPSRKEPWFWFVMTPLLLSVLTSIPFVYLAYHGADERVIDDYYTEGKTINHRFAADGLAKQLGVVANLRFDTTTGEVLCELSGLKVYPAELNLELSHPFQSAKDQRLILKRVNNSRYRADVPQQLQGRWYIALQATAPDSPDTWRLLGGIDLRQNQALTIPSPAPGTEG